MLVSLLRPGTDDKVVFSYSDLHGIPKKSGCYVLTVDDGTILYIGKATNICRRIEQHLAEGDKREKTPWGVALWVHYALCPDIELKGLEHYWTHQYRMREKGKLPFFNKVMPPA